MRAREELEKGVRMALEVVEGPDPLPPILILFLVIKGVRRRWKSKSTVSATSLSGGR